MRSGWLDVLGTWFLLFAFGVLLFGCASPHQPVVVQTREIKVPVLQRCVFPTIEKPDLATAKVDPEDSRVLIKGARALMAEVKQREAYTQKLEAAIAACKKGEGDGLQGRQ